MNPECALLSPGHAARLLERVIYEQVLDAIDFAVLNELEATLAIELGRLGVTDDEMVDMSHAMVTRALHRLTNERMHGDEQHDETEKLRTRYVNAVCGN